MLTSYRSTGWVGEASADRSLRDMFEHSLGPLILCYFCSVAMKSSKVLLLFWGNLKLRTFPVIRRALEILLGDILPTACILGHQGLF